MTEEDICYTPEHCAVCCGESADDNRLVRLGWEGDGPDLDLVVAKDAPSYFLLMCQNCIRKVRRLPLFGLQAGFHTPMWTPPVEQAIPF